MCTKMEENEHISHMQQVFLRMCTSDQSVVIGPERHNRIVDVLLGYKLPSPSFKFWMKKNDFQLIDIPSTNETNVLVAPGKHTSDREIRYVRVLRLEDIYPAVQEIHAVQQNHAGSKKCFEAASKLYYRLPRSYIEQFVRTCPTCSRRKNRKAEVLSPYHNMLTEKPTRRGVLEKIKVNTIDVNHISTAGFNHVGIVEDQHSKFVVLFPLRSNTPTDVAQALNHYYLGVFGPPLSFISDNGHEFMDHVLHELLHLWSGIPLTLINETAPNIAEEDVSDRCGIIYDTLNSLIQEKGDQKCSWHDWLPDIALRLNTTQNEFKRSPYNLVFGRNAHGGEYNSNVIIKSVEEDIGPLPDNEDDAHNTDSCSNGFVLEETDPNNANAAEAVLASVGLERRTSNRKQEQAAAAAAALKSPDQNPSGKLAKSLLPVVRNIKKEKKKSKKLKPFALAGCKDKVVVKATTSGVINAMQRSKLGIIASASPNVRRTKSRMAVMDADDSFQLSEEESDSDSEEASSEDDDDVLGFLRKGLGEKTKMKILKTVLASLVADQKKKKRRKKRKVKPKCLL